MQGFFDDKNKKYVIKDMKPRRPWLNYLWNGSYGVSMRSVRPQCGMSYLYG